MASKSSPASDAAIPATDKFHLITGIGPATERLLQDGGIRTFSQLATLSPTEIFALISSDRRGMSAERIAREDWIGEALKRAPEPAPAEPRHRAMPPGNRQHYATFTVELLLDEDNNVRRTHVVYIQDPDVKYTRAGWEEGRLVKFITRHAALRLPAAELAPPPTAATAEPAPPSAGESVGLGGTLRSHKLETLLPDATDPRSILRHDQPFNVRLTLDLAEVTVSSGDPLDYTAVVYARSMNGGVRQAVGKTRGTVVPDDRLTIVMKSRSLPRGIYCLEADVTCTLPPVGPGLKAHLEGGLLQIY